MNGEDWFAAKVILQRMGKKTRYMIKRVENSLIVVSDFVNCLITLHSPINFTDAGKDY